MKRKILLVSAWACVLVCMTMIFNFSGQDGEKSSETSKKVVETVLGVVMKKEDITPPVVAKYQFPIRKAAHFGIYMLLGFSLSCAYLITFNKNGILPYGCALVTSVLYAVSDEIHQNFTLNRGPSARDILIDSSGAIAGIIIYALFILSVSKLKKREQTPVI